MSKNVQTLSNKKIFSAKLISINNFKKLLKVD